MEVSVDKKGDGIYLRLTRPADQSLGGKVPLLFEPTVLLVSGSTLGRGDDELGNGADARRSFTRWASRTSSPTRSSS